MSLSQGTPVEWNTPQGPTHGRIVQKKVSDFELDGHPHRAVRTSHSMSWSPPKPGPGAHKASALTVKK